MYRIYKFFMNKKKSEQLFTRSRIMMQAKQVLTRWSFVLIGGLFMLGVLAYWSQGWAIKNHPLPWSPTPLKNRSDKQAALNVLRRDGVSTRLSDVNIDNMTDQQILLTTHSILDNVDTICNRKLRMGNLGDGGWEVCDDPDVAPEPPCTIYSFGINWDFSFDDDVSRVFACHVFSFDPSMKANHSERSKLVSFRKYGISGTTKVEKQNWQMFTLKDLKKELGHDQKKISLIKMDIEKSEWDAVPEMLSSGAFNGVKQFLVEFHVFKTDRKYLLGKLKMIQAIEKFGFKKFYVHKNPGCPLDVSNFPMKSCACYEVHYVYRP